MERFAMYRVNKRATGEKIKALFKKSSYTMEDWLDYLAVLNDQSVYKWYAGKTLPKIEHLMLMSQRLHVHIEDIVVCDEETVERMA